MHVHLLVRGGRLCPEAPGVSVLLGRAWPNQGMQATANSVSSCLELGDLPVGVYRATLAEVVAHLGHGTVQRVAITARLERIYELARRTSSVQRLTASGARSQRRPNPRDIDVFLVMQGGFQPRDAPPEAQILFRHDTAQNELGASILWVNAETSFADTEDLIIGWQTRRDLQRRGINDGYQRLDGLRRTGDGYYESVVLDPEGNRLEITV